MYILNSTYTINLHQLGIPLDDFPSWSGQSRTTSQLKVLSPPTQQDILNDEILDEYLDRQKTASSLRDVLGCSCIHKLESTHCLKCHNRREGIPSCWTIGPEAENVSRELDCVLLRPLSPSSQTPPPIEK